jgi:hypothetical protein
MDKEVENFRQKNKNGHKLVYGLSRPWSASFSRQEKMVSQSCYVQIISKASKRSQRMIMLQEIFPRRTL